VNAMLYVGLAAVALIALSLLLGGCGLLVRRACGLPVRSTSDLLLAPWVGWCLAVLILQIWHLAFPVDRRVLLVIAATGLAGLLLNAGEIARRAAGWPWRSRWMALLIAAAAVWVANQTTTQPKHPDSPLYHIVSVRWATDYAIVPGLGNLRNILGYNSSFFLYAAMLDNGPFQGKFHHLAGGLLLFLLLARILHGASRLLAGDRARAWHVFDALFLVPVILYVMGDYGSSPSPDVAVFALGVAAASELLRQYVEAEGREEGGLSGAGGRDREACYAVFVLSLLATVGITVKVSFAAFALTLGALALFARLKTHARGPLLDGRTAAWIAGGGILLLGTWMVRGIITSGYPAYPSTFLGWPVEWRVSAEMARRNAESVCAWARMPGVPPEQVLGNWRWVWLWANRMLRNGYTVVLPLTLAAVLAPVLHATGREQTGARRSALPWLFLVLPIAGLAFWFLTAPEPRFAGAAFWILANGAVALALRSGDALRPRMAVACMTVTLFFSNVDVVQFVKPWNKDMGPVKQGVVEAMTTRSGLTVFVPLVDGQCWDAPLPCTTSRQQLDPDLRLRVPGDLSRGFVVGRQTL